MMRVENIEYIVGDSFNIYTTFSACLWSILRTTASYTDMRVGIASTADGWRFILVYMRERANAVRAVGEVLEKMRRMQ